MQWDGTVHAGFTEEGAEPWLPVQNNADSINVEVQEASENSLLQTYQALLRLRSESLPLKWGSLQLQEAGIPDGILSYRRIYRDREVVVYINFSEEAQVLPEDGTAAIMVGQVLLQDGRLNLGGNSGVVIRKGS